MDITTIKVRRQTKQELDLFRNRSESYDEIIRKLMTELRRKALTRQLVEAYRKMGKGDLALLEEWEAASREL